MLTKGFREHVNRKSQTLVLVSDRGKGLQQRCAKLSSMGLVCMAHWNSNLKRPCICNLLEELRQLQYSLKSFQ